MARKERTNRKKTTIKKSGPKKGHARGDGTPLTKGEMLEARVAVESYNTITEAANSLGLSRQTLSYRYRQALQHGIGPESAETVEVSEKANMMKLEYLGTKIETADALLEDCDVDLTEWYVDRVVIKNWEVAGKAARKNADDKLWKTNLRSIRVYLKRKSDVQVAFEKTVQDLRDLNFAIIPYKPPKARKGKPRRALEISLMDPHLGLQCFPPESDNAWSIDDCANLALWAVEELISLGAPYGPFEEIVFPFGNDYLHVDNLQHATTKGTPQPEAMSYHYVYQQGLRLAVSMVDRMRMEAPVRVFQIPGNHDRVSAYTVGHFLWAYYDGRKGSNVVVDASASPYKFWRFGTNLVGFDHGCAVRPNRLAALMANECSGPGNQRAGWFDETTYREWHLGDQHRKGSGSIVAFEEQGVSVEYLPSLTPANAWHRVHGYNWQKRGAVGYVWDYDTGPVARVQVNLNSYTGTPTGRSKTAIDKLFQPGTFEVFR